MPHIMGAAFLALAMQLTIPMEPNCSRPVTEAELGRLFEANLEEDDIVRHLVKCEIGADLTPESAILAQVKPSTSLLKVIEWIRDWELMGAEGDKIKEKVGLDASGSWAGTFSDSKMHGELRLTVAQSPGGTIRGTYSSSLGGGGDFFGSIWAKDAKIRLSQTVSWCPGYTKAKIRIEGESLHGEYIGYDCTGLHLNGHFTLARAIVPPSVDETRPKIVAGSELELRSAKTVHVWAQAAQINEKTVIEHVLRSKKIELHDDRIKADIILEYREREGRPFLVAERLIIDPERKESTIRIVWFCREYPNDESTVRIAEHCARQFASVYAEVNR